MIRSAATIAIVGARLRSDARIGVFAAAACALLAYLQRNEDAPAHLAGSLVFGTLLAVTIALLQRGAGRCREIELCELAAPLYGRELARATALVPCMLACAAAGTYWLVAASYERPSIAAIGFVLLAVCAAALIGLCASLRTGFPRALYAATACAIPAGAYVLAASGLPWGMMFCALAGFVALRQYGEALARHDPVTSLAPELRTTASRVWPG